MNFIQVNIYEFSFGAGQPPFFEDLHFTIEEGDFNFLVGMSGVGKTTLLNLILDLTDKKGNTKINFQYEGTQNHVYQIRNQGLIGYLSQTPSLVPWETILSNFEIPSKLNKKLVTPPIECMVNELESIGLDKEVLKLYPHQLSFGMQSRAALVRTLLYRPAFIFLDELFTGIDVLNSALIEEKLKTYMRINKPVCLSITHNVERAIQSASNIFVLGKNRTIHKITTPCQTNQVLTFFNQN